MAEVQQQTARKKKERQSVKVGPYEIVGRSIAGEHSCVLIPSLKIGFDIGGHVQTESIPVPFICVTHGHMDHVGGIAAHAATRSLRSMDSPTYLVPPAAVKGVQAVFEAFFELDGGEGTMPKIRSPAIGEETPFFVGHFVKPFHTRHRVPSQGYLVTSRRKRLKPEYQGSTKQETQALVMAAKAAKVECVEEVSVAEIAYTGDTMLESVLANEEVLNARLLIMEVTYLESERPVAQAHKYGHVHLDEVIEHADKFKNEYLLFTHFSARYSAAAIVDILDRRLPPSLKSRVTPLLNGFSDFESVVWPKVNSDSTVTVPSSEPTQDVPRDENSVSSPSVDGTTNSC
eukprot:GILK01004764.1.p1 GENE.GILK01004764.1~~GILK01004764.1.p1  ORF type:complete len:344 (-),score=34.58 GILK01004764.1:145-1176(-)